MAKFNEYTQKTTPEDADTLMIYDDVAKANKLSPFSGIWNWIVGKLTNAVISNLQTNDKTVLGAINELNSNLQIELSWRQYEDIETAISSESEKIINPKGHNKIIRTVTNGGHPYLILIGIDQDGYGCGVCIDYNNTTVKAIRSVGNRVEFVSQ